MAVKKSSHAKFTYKIQKELIVPKIFPAKTLPSKDVSCIENVPFKKVVKAYIESISTSSLQKTQQNVQPTELRLLTSPSLISWLISSGFLYN